MNKFAHAIAGLAVWRPGVALMKQIRFTRKMALISAAFALPLFWLLGSAVVSNWREIDTVTQERVGVQYARVIYPLIEAAGVWRYQARNAAFGEPAESVEAARQQFDALLKQLEAVDAGKGAKLSTAQDMDKVRAATRIAQAPQKDPQAIYQALVDVSRTLVALLDHVTDSTGLALDSELPTYYLVSATLMRTPTCIQSVSELRGLGRSAFKAGQITPAQAAGMQERLGLLSYQNQMVASDLQKVKQGAPDHAPTLAMGATDGLAHFEALVRRSFAPGAHVPDGELAAYMREANQTLAAQFEQAKQNLQVMDARLEARQAALWRETSLSLAVALGGLLLATYCFMSFFSAMAQDFVALRRHMINISMGDLRSDINVVGHDEMAGLFKELRNMQTALSDIVQRVQEASGTVVKSSIEIAQGTQDLSTRTETAAAALQQSSSALEETTATVKMTADTVKKASDIATHNAATATQGGHVVQDVVHTMERIQTSSQRISDIIGVIDGIAFQTNILALNAAVEAARAGEQGRGFAVVATEVRALAGRSASAAKEIKTLISASTQEVAAGTDVVRQAGTTMNEIVDNASQIKQLLDEIATGAREQDQGITQIGLAVHELDQSTQANAALVEQTAAVANAQRVVAVQMAAKVDEFRLAGHRAGAMVEGVDVDAYIDAHRQWKVKLRDAIESRALVDVRTLSCDNCCALGKWVYGDGQRLRERGLFSSLVSKHARFHQVAGAVGELINQKHYEQAEDALAPGTPFSQATSEVVAVLSSAKRLGF